MGCWHAIPPNEEYQQRWRWLLGNRFLCPSFRRLLQWNWCILYIQCKTKDTISYYLLFYYLRILSKNVISLFRNFHWSNISSFFFSCFFLLLFWFSRVLGFSLLLLLVEFFSLVQLSVRLYLLLLPLLKYLHLHYYCYCLLSRGWYLVLSKEEEIKVGIVTKTEISKAITITIKRKPSGFFIYSYYIYSVFLFL